MFLKLVLFIFVAKTGADLRIVNGTSADQGEFKFVVALKVNGMYGCGGTILNENYILTAAHCVCSCHLQNTSYPCDPLCKPSSYSIQFGLVTLTKDSTNVISVSEIFINPGYSMMKTMIYDAAVLKLTTPLPSNNPDWEKVQLLRKFKSHSGITVGWGRLKWGGNASDRLQKLTVDIYSDEICGKLSIHQSIIHPFHHICVGAQHALTCQGDSGTALLVDGSQVGITSFGTHNCSIANETYPDVFARIDNYYDWILDKSTNKSGRNDGNYKRVNDCVLAFVSLASVIFCMI